MRRVLLVLAAVVAVAGSSLPAPASSSGNVSLVEDATIAFRGGTDLDFAGHYAYVGSYDNEGDGGLYIVDIADPTNPQIAGRFRCWGYQDDVGVRSYVDGDGNDRVVAVLAMHNSGTAPGCSPVRKGGLRVVDVTDPANPVQTGFVETPGGTHTLTMIGDTGYVYANPGGLSATAARQATQIVDVRDPSNPAIVATFTPPGSSGCHDINVNEALTRAYCAGSNVTQIWDITDPLRPRVVAAIANPAIFFHHGAVPSPDGRTLVIADEAFALHACDPASANPTGSFWVYDITVESAPVLKSWIHPARDARAVFLGYDCTAHNFNMVPGTTLMVAASYEAGTTVIDYGKTPPEIVGWIVPDGADTWSAYWYDGYVYTGDLVRGFDVIGIDGL